MESTQPLGVIGLGLIGTSLATRLLQAGFPVAGFDIADDRRANLARLGGTPCATARESSARPEMLMALIPRPGRAMRAWPPMSSLKR